jgi:hypothetical protein
MEIDVKSRLNVLYVIFVSAISAIAAAAQAPTALIGNGKLTARVASDGTVASCRWPSPGYFEQLGQKSLSTDAEQAPSIGWAVAIGSDVHWLAAATTPKSTYIDSAPFGVRMQTTMPGTATAVDQIVFVHPTKDLLIFQCIVHDEIQNPRLFFYADFSPSVSLPAELPLGFAPIGRVDDFAAVALDETNCIAHFRPDETSRYNYDDAIRLLGSVQRGQKMDLSPFKSGVWIALAALQPVKVRQVGNENSPTSARSGVDQARLTPQSVAVGFCDSALEIEAEKDENGYSATVVIAFGETQKQILRLLKESTSAGYNTLFFEAQSYWNESLSAKKPSSPDPVVSALSKRCLAVLIASNDTKSGAMVREAGSTPRLADSPEDGAWAIAAFDAVGLSENAERHIQFYSEAVRTLTTRGKPSGSMPSALFANKSPATPNVVLDFAAPAWYLWACRQHARVLEREASKKWLDVNWTPISAAADFLAAWKDPRTGEPLATYNAALGRDSKDTKALLDAHTGLASAVWMANLLGKDAQPWRQTLQGYNDLVRRKCLSDSESWTSKEVWPSYGSDVFPPKDPRWNSVLTQMITAIPTLDSERAAGMLCNAALIASDLNTGQVQLREILAVTMTRCLGLDSQANDQLLTSMTAIDSRIASELLLAASILYPPENP